MFRTLPGPLADMAPLTNSSRMHEKSMVEGLPRCAPHVSRYEFYK